METGPGAGLRPEAQEFVGLKKTLVLASWGNPVRRDKKIKSKIWHLFDTTAHSNSTKREDDNVTPD
jgi:hypothetical protein